MTEQEISAEIQRRFTDPTFVQRASTRAMRAAVLEHKRAGNPVAGWKDGKLVIVQPEDIDISDEDEKQ